MRKNIRKNSLFIIAFWFISVFIGCVSSQANKEEHWTVEKLRIVENQACSCTDTTCAETAFKAFLSYIEMLRQEDVCISDEVAEKLKNSSAHTARCLLQSGIDPHRIRTELSKTKSSRVAVKSYDYGIYDTNKDTAENADSLPADGKKLACKCVLIKQTNEIPLSLGTSFGIRFMIISKCNITVNVKIKHPKIVNPADNKESYQVEGSITKIPDVIQYTGYKFDNQYEMVPGEWIIELWHENKMLLQQKFNIKEKI